MRKSTRFALIALGILCMLAAGYYASVLLLLAGIR